MSFREDVECLSIEFNAVTHLCICALEDLELCLEQFVEKIGRFRMAEEDKLKCPDCNHALRVEFVNELGYRLRCVHCHKSIVRWNE